MVKDGERRREKEGKGRGRTERKKEYMEGRLQQGGCKESKWERESKRMVERDRE